MKLSRVLAVTLAACLAGCFPMHFNACPGAEGRVIDSVTAIPIANATVTLTLRGRREDRLVKSTTTDASGRFAFLPDKSWGVYIVPMDFAPLLADVDASASGYGHAACQARSFPDGPGTADCGDIRLDKQP